MTGQCSGFMSRCWRSAAWWSSRRNPDKADDYFLAGHHAPAWLVAISALSTMQSAATFLGAPDNSYRGDWSYLTSNFAAIIAAAFVARLLIPRYYALGVTTVYELLEQRFDRTARRAAAGMYLVGRVLASGARLYLAAIAVSMIIFLDVEPQHILIASAVLVVFGIVFTLFGGLNAVIWSDLVQVVLYVGGALIVFFLLWNRIPAPASEIWEGLRHVPGDVDKLRLFDWSLNWSKPFTIWAILTGLVLLNIGNAGLDQDTSQRFLACEDAKAGKHALYLSMWMTIPVVALFMAIGSLLHIFYERPDLMGVSASVMQGFSGEKITIFMSFILSEIPPGVRGLITVGVIAAAAINSGLISMSAVLVSDFYRPWKERRGAAVGEHHYVNAGRWAMILLALALFAMSILCFYWQRYTDMPCSNCARRDDLCLFRIARRLCDGAVHAARLDRFGDCCASGGFFRDPAATALCRRQSWPACCYEGPRLPLAAVHWRGAGVHHLPFGQSKRARVAPGPFVIRF